MPAWPVDLEEVQAGRYDATWGEAEAVLANPLAVRPSNVNFNAGRNDARLELDAIADIKVDHREPD